MIKYTRLILGILILTCLISIKFLLDWMHIQLDWNEDYLVTIRQILLVAAGTWIAIEILRIIKYKILKHYDLTQPDNLRSRKLHTQINLLEKIIVFVLIITAIGLSLLSIDSIREIGIGIFASAGIMGIILGLSAQKIVGALLAGIQIAITQPFRLDDAVVVENEWGWIEEINLTYIVVRLWDKRRLVLPTTYFIEHPFQNWTRTTADIVGSVFIYTDYTLPIDAIRSELTRILNTTSLWDQKTQVVQVTDSKENYMEIRILVSAKDSPTAWDLRVFVREKLIEYIRTNYPESLPKTRINIEN